MHGKTSEAFLEKESRLFRGMGGSIQVARYHSLGEMCIRDSYVGGLSGAFIPVSEDQGMIDAVSAGALTLEKLEAMTCVCSVGLDMIAIPGDTKATTISGIIADEMAIGMVNQKTTAVRLIPVIGKTVGFQDRGTIFSNFEVNCTA